MPSAKPLRILYIEDDASIRTVTTMSLRTIGGFHVTDFSNGPDALLFAKESIPDLILLDVMMPEMDGPTTLKHLRTLEGFSEIPAVFFTAKNPSTHDDLLKDHTGVTQVISKPFDPILLPQQILSGLQYREEVFKWQSHESR